MGITSEDLQRIHLFYDRKAHTTYQMMPEEHHHSREKPPSDWPYRSICTYRVQDIRAHVRYWSGKYQDAKKNLLVGGSNAPANEVEKNLLAGGLPKMSVYPQDGKKVGGIRTTDRVSFGVVFPIDIDADDLRVASRMARNLCQLLDDFEAPYDLFFSGRKGFHIEIVATAVDPTLKTLGYSAETVFDTARIFVSRLASIADATVDTSIYTRHGKWRRCGCPRRDDDGNLTGKHKIYLKSPSDLKYFDYMEAASTKKAFIQRRPPQRGAGDVQENKTLRKMWRNAYESAKSKPPVRVFSTGGKYFSGTGSKPKFVDSDVEGVRQEVLSRSGRDATNMGKYHMVKCPHPDHGDRDPSAMLNQDGSVWCTACHEYFSVAKIASWFGKTLRTKEEEEVDLEADKPDLDEMTVEQRLEWYERKKIRDIPVDDLTDVEGVKAALKERLEEVLDEGKSAVVRSSVGMGKSSTTRELLMDLGLSSLWMAPTHNLLREAGADFDKLGGHRHLRKFSDVAPGCEELEMPLDHSLMDPDDRRKHLRDSSLNPSRADEIRFRQQVAGISRGSVCGTCPRNPRSSSFDNHHPMGTCPFIEHVEEFFDTENAGDDEATIIDLLDDEEEAPTQWLMPSAHIGLSGVEKVIDDVDVVVIDESAMDHIYQVDLFDMADLRILGSDRFADIEINNPSGDYSYRWGYIWKRLTRSIDGSIQILRLLKCSLPDFAGMEGVDELGGEDGIIYEDGLDKAIRKAAKAGEGYHIGLETDDSHAEAIKLLRGLKKGKYNKIKPIYDHEGKLYLVCVERRDLEWAEDTPVVILDATATAEETRTYSLLFDRRFEDLRFVAQNPDTKVIHDPVRSWSRDKCRKYLYDDETDPKPVRDLLNYIRDLEGEVGIISWKDNPVVTEVLIPSDLISPELYCHYGALRGIDRMAGVDHLVILGDPSVNELAFKQEYIRRCGDREGYGDSVVFSSGYKASHYLLHYPIVHGRDRTGRKIHRKVVLKEIQQGIGRARGLWHDVKIHAFCSPDAHMLEFDYEVVPGNVSPAASVDKMWNLALHTYKSKKAIHEESGLSYEFVKNRLGDVPLEKIRISYAQRLYEELGSWSKVAKRMGTTRQTLLNKRKKHGV